MQGTTLPPGLVQRPGGRILAQAYDPRTRKRVGKTFDSISAAKGWRRDTEVSLARGTLQAGKSPTLAVAAAEFLTGATEGTIRSRSRQRYKPSTLKRYKLGLTNTLLPALGSQRLSDIRPGRLTKLIGELESRGLSASSVRNTVIPLQAIFRWAIPAVRLRSSEAQRRGPHARCTSARRRPEQQQTRWTQGRRCSLVEPMSATKSLTTEFDTLQSLRQGLEAELALDTDGSAKAQRVDATATAFRTNQPAPEVVNRNQRRLELVQCS